MIPSTDVIQLTLTPKMTTAQVVETSVTVYIHPDDQTQPFEMTPGFKPFTRLNKLPSTSIFVAAENGSVEAPGLVALFLLKTRTFGAKNW